MAVNEIGQEVDGGVPITNLSVSDITTYHGAILASDTSGDLATWAGEGNAINLFSAKSNGTYDLSATIIEDLAGRDLAYVIDYINDAIFG